MPDARVTAAEGLLLLGRQPAMMNGELTDLIMTLTADPDVAVRYQTAVHLHVVSITAPALAWAALDAIFRRESNRSVLNAALRPLQILGQSESARVAAFLEDLFQRTSNAGGNGDEVHLNCAKILMDLALWENDDRSTAFIGRLIDAPEQYHEELCHIAFHLARGLCSDRSDIVTRAFQFLERILNALLEALRAIETRCGEETRWPPEASEKYSGALRAVDQIALRLSMDAGCRSLRSRTRQC